MSGQCANLCSKKPKAVRMFLEARNCVSPACRAAAEPHKHELPIYLCAPCARELGHV